MSPATPLRSWITSVRPALCALLCASVAAAAAWASPPVTLTDANDSTNPVTYSAGPFFVPNMVLTAHVHLYQGSKKRSFLEA